MEQSSVTFERVPRRFPLGETVATPGALELLRLANLPPFILLMFHASGNWGCVDPEDALENEFAIQEDLRILSAYEVLPNRKVWVITERGRGLTTILLPEEY